VDEYDGMAWVSLTPFLMAAVRPAGVPIEPGFSTFPETNLRTYVRRPDGRDGQVPSPTSDHHASTTSSRA
jgi:uncharacterized protein